jgi:hypothetical protein
MAMRMGPAGVVAEKARTDALAAMDLMAITRAYVLAAVDAAPPGYRALLLDKETMRMASTICGRTELGEHNVVHIERIDAKEPGTASKKSHRELKARLGPNWRGVEAERHMGPHALAQAGQWGQPTA